MKIKALVHIAETTLDTYGNKYRAAKVTNPANGKSFTTRANSEGNVLNILGHAFPHCDYKDFYTTVSSTGSAKTASLPACGEALNECHYGKDWKKALTAIGFRGLPSCSN